MWHTPKSNHIIFSTAQVRRYNLYQAKNQERHVFHCHLCFFVRTGRYWYPGWYNILQTLPSRMEKGAGLIQLYRFSSALTQILWAPIVFTAFALSFLRFWRWGIRHTCNPRGELRDPASSLTCKAAPMEAQWETQQSGRVWQAWGSTTVKEWGHVDGTKELLWGHDQASPSSSCNGPEE